MMKERGEKIEIKSRVGWNQWIEKDDQSFDIREDGRLFPSQ